MRARQPARRERLLVGPLARCCPCVLLRHLGVPLRTVLHVEADARDGVRQFRAFGRSPGRVVRARRRVGRRPRRTVPGPSASDASGGVRQPTSVVRTTARGRAVP
ncbi:hypothetical protein APASM_2934 [Actinosynnema pretiosum subsp. pretiosum]|nr:hypothetical protein APASM_2934 [Actinosynnema pretiosum subsp. pretiosum]